MPHRSAIRRSILATAAYCWIALAAAAQQNGASPNATANYRVSGVVVSKTDGHPLDRARVTLRDSKSRKEAATVVTSQDGKFAFEHLSAGKYALDGARRGFVAAGYDQHDQYSTAIVTGAGVDTENLVLQLSPEAIIYGRVLDEAGEPVRHAAVTLYRKNHFQGVDQIQPSSSAQTDDLGAYELISLTPGTYFLSVRAQPWYAFHPPLAAEQAGSDGNGGTNPNFDRSLDVAYPVTYYENVTETDDATPIQIRGDERLQIDIYLNPVPALRLIFHVDRNHEIVAPQLQQTVFGSVNYVQTTALFTRPGILELTGIPAGRYNVRIPGSNTVTELNAIDLNKDGEEIDTSAAEPLGSMKVSVRVPGDSVIPQNLAVGLISNRNDYGGFHSLNANRETEIQQVAAGTYEMRLLSAGKPYVIIGISADGAQVKGHTITLPAGASATVSLTLALGVEVQGVAKKAGKPFAGAMVVLVPKNPEESRDLFRRDQSDLDGTFSLRGVAPGSYTLIAIQDGWNLDWSQPEVIATYVKHGHPLEVPGGTPNPMRVKEAIEVQPK